MRILNILLFILLIPVFRLYAQDISIKKVELAGPNVIIHYDLIDTDIDKRYTIFMYLSTDDFTQPSEKVEGDIGIDISPGANKKVIWHAAEQLSTDFNGRISIRLNGNIYTPFITLQGFNEGVVFKRGVDRQVIWSGGREDNVLDFELLKGDDPTGVIFDNISNVVGSQSFNIPTSISPGKNYRFRISDSNNREEMVYSPSFVIKRKIPLAAKIGAGVLVGVAGYLIYNSLQETTIEDPPGLPSR